MKIKLLFSLLSLGFIGSLYSMRQAPNEMLIRGAGNSDIKLVEEALEQKADTNYKDKHGWTALMWAALDKENKAIVKLLLDNRANPNLQNNNGWTVLMLAAARGNENIVRMLLEKGANPNIQNNDGWTALMYAAIRTHKNVVKLLLDNGASLNLVNRDGKTAREYIERGRHHKMFIEGAYEGDIKLVQEALGQKKRGYIASILTAIKSAISGKSGNKEVVEDINIRDDNGNTALMAAVHKGNLDLVKLLLDNGANLDIKNYGDETALDMAKRKGYLSIVDLIENEPARREKLRQEVRKQVSESGYLSSKQI